MSFDAPNPDRPQIGRPVPYLHVKIDGGTRQSFSKLSFYFTQELASVIRPTRVELVPVDGEKRGQSSEKVEQKDVTSLDEPVQIGSLTIHFINEWRCEDFRETGIIHLEGANPVDRP